MARGSKQIERVAKEVRIKLSILTHFIGGITLIMKYFFFYSTLVATVTKKVLLSTVNLSFTFFTLPACADICFRVMSCVIVCHLAPKVLKST